MRRASATALTRVLACVLAFPNPSYLERAVSVPTIAQTAITAAVADRTKKKNHCDFCPERTGYAHMVPPTLRLLLTLFFSER